MPGDRFSDLEARPLPEVPKLWAALGPGIVWMALAQGSGELYYWPYFAAKYGALYLCLLVPACVLQTPLNLEIGRYTLLTGESVFVGFTRLSRAFGLGLWALFAVNFIFIGGWASAGGTALKDILDWPAGWGPRARTLLWSYVITALFAGALFVGRVVYRVVERFMMAIAAVTAVGLVVASLHPRVLEALPAFARALAAPSAAPAPPADLRELERFVTMICYSGLGGFWSLFYSFWTREKGFGMAAYAGHITSPLTGRKDLVTLRGFRFEDTPENAARWRRWVRTLKADTAVGILGNLFTTLLMALLAFAILHPKGRYPEGWNLAAEQAAFFGDLWGPGMRLVFLVISGCFLMDSWLAGVDAVSRVHAEMLCTYSGRARAKGLRFWYYAFLGGMLAVTWSLLPVQEPGAVLTLTGVISLFAVPVFAGALWVLNYVRLPRRFPSWTRAGPVQQALFLGVIAFYLVASVYYLWVRIRMAGGAS
jgi:Mn2+/Fe2+ NRAMP family transporter